MFSNVVVCSVSVYVSICVFLCVPNGKCMYKCTAMHVEAALGSILQVLPTFFLGLWDLELTNSANLAGQLP